MELDEQYDDFCEQNKQKINCMFIGVGEFQSKAQKTQRVGKDRTIAEIIKFLRKNFSVDSNVSLVQNPPANPSV